MEEVSDPLRALEDVLKPDARQGSLVHELRHVHEMLSAMTLHGSVPVGVRQLFETAKNVRLYTYFVYPFHQVAEMTAYQALEMSLLVRWQQEHGGENAAGSRRAPTLGVLLRHAASNGWIHNNGFSGRFWRAERSLIAERCEIALLAGSGDQEAMTINDPTEAEIQDRAEKIDVVSALVRSVPKMRNDLAHGSSRLVPISDYVLQDVRDAINMIFTKE